MPRLVLFWFKFSKMVTKLANIELSVVVVYLFKILKGKPGEVFFHLSLFLKSGGTYFFKSNTNILWMKA